MEATIPAAHNRRREVSRGRAPASHFRTEVMKRRSRPMNCQMNLQSALPAKNASWALQMRATTMEEPGLLIQTLTGAILGCGGWVLSRGADDAGVIDMLFEFERNSCVEMYTVLVAAGLDLSQLAHLRFTELCQCTRSHHDDCSGEIVSIDLEIQSFPAEKKEATRSDSEAA